MEQDKKEQLQQADATKTQDTEQGRQPGGPQQTATERNSDISQVDQQEGQMMNGELGGNFDTGGS